MNISKRYERNIWIRQIGESGQKKISDSKILVCGAGGIGCSLLMNLAALGIGKIGIVDKDFVETSNLNRQILYTPADVGKPKVYSSEKKLKDFNPEIEVIPYNIELTFENSNDIVKDYDIIADCFDSKKSVLLLHKIAMFTNKPLITGGGCDLTGCVFTVLPHKSKCLGCYGILTDSENNEAENNVSMPVSTCALLGALYSFEILKIITERIGSLAVNNPFYFDGETYKTLRTEKTDNSISICPICGSKIDQ